MARENTRTARRLYLVRYHAWLEAEDRWQATIQEIALLVPSARTHPTLPIGQPGSRVRRIYDARVRAIEALQVARRVYGAMRAASEPPPKSRQPTGHLPPPTNRGPRQGSG